MRVAIVGLGFGAEFIPIYQNHPDAEMYAICRRNKAELDKVGDRFGVATRYAEFEQVLNNDPLDLDYEVIDGEERYRSIGLTNQGRL